MGQILSYPTYSLPRESLRSLLLFYDTIITIVPEVDRKGVDERPQIYDIKKYEPTAIEFADPEPHLGWSTRTGVEETLRNMALENAAADQEIEDFIQSANIDVERGERVTLEPDQAKRFFQKDWMLVAEQRIHPELMKVLFELRLAMPIAAWPYPDTHQVATFLPLLVNGKAGRFMLARLARCFDVILHEHGHDLAVRRRKLEKERG